MVVIPAGVKHWHGAARDCWFAHLALSVVRADATNEWCESVSDEEYDARGGGVDGVAGGVGAVDADGW